MRPITLLAAGLVSLSALGWGSAAAAQAFEQTGSASWYGAGHHGKKTASGERFDMHKLTAAHPKLPLGSVLEVTNLANDRTVELRVNDRGPYKGARILDVSREAADQLGFLSAGTAKVRIRLVDKNAGELRPKLPAEPVLDLELLIAAAEPAAEAAADASTPGYVVQVGTFAVRANAERAADRVVGIGAAKVSEDWRSGRVLHRVSLGRWSDRAAAEAARMAAVEAGFPDARVAEGS